MSIIDIRNQLRYWITERNKISVNSPKFKGVQEKVFELEKQYTSLIKEL